MRPSSSSTQPWASATSSTVATTPVPMAQTGSYATQSGARAGIPSSARPSWRLSTSRVSLRSRSASVSPMQRTGFSPARRTPFILA